MGSVTKEEIHNKSTPRPKKGKGNRIKETNTKYMSPLILPEEKEKKKQESDYRPVLFLDMDLQVIEQLKKIKINKKTEKCIPSQIHITNTTT